MEQVFAYKEQLLSGTLTTVALALCSLGLAVALGIIGMLAKVSANALARRLATIYTTLIRSIPDLCLMLLVYYGGQQIVNAIGQAAGWWDYLEINQFTAGVATIGFIFGAYMTETFRGALMSIPPGQFEAAKALGVPRGITFRKVVLPQLFYYALPSFGNNWLILLKTTALVSVIGLQDVVWKAFAAGRATGQLFTFFFITLLVYLLITFVSDVALSRLEKRLSAGFGRN